MKLHILFIFFLIYSLYGLPQSKYQLGKGVDVIHYDFHLILSDDSDTIRGAAMIEFALAQYANNIQLDFINAEDGMGGMQVLMVEHDGQSLKYNHQKDRLVIKVPDHPKVYSVTIMYEGVPREGLIIGMNKFGARTFFGDNYPDRARNWLPCVDFPADKSTVSWTVVAPGHYQVVANGSFISRKDLQNGDAETVWKESIPISTKLMVIGVSKFSVQKDSTTNVPISYWVYPENADEGFSDYSYAPKIMAYLENKIGDFPYEKLAHVQSKTRYGGMENASNIFYFENSVNGKRDHENLIVHETVHQWFGDAVTEANWSHAWLSEGFATYLTHAYVEDHEGKEKVNERMRKERADIITYSKKALIPVVNKKLSSFPRVGNVPELLSTNTYKKGGWILHMLRKKLGENTFWNGLRNYYSKYKNKIATTEDFQNIMEYTSGVDLSEFFDQWLFGAGQPVLGGSWEYNSHSRNIRITIIQSGKLYEVPLEIGIVTGDNMKIVSQELTGSSSTFIVSATKEPDKIVLDPGVYLLYEGPDTLEKK